MTIGKWLSREYGLKGQHMTWIHSGDNSPDLLSIMSGDRQCVRVGIEWLQRHLPVTFSVAKLTGQSLYDRFIGYDKVVIFEIHPPRPAMNIKEYVLKTHPHLAIPGGSITLTVEAGNQQPARCYGMITVGEAWLKKRLPVTYTEFLLEGWMKPGRVHQTGMLFLHPSEVP